MHWYINWKSSVSSTEETSRFYSLSIKLMNITQTRCYEMSWKLVLIVSVWNQLRGLKWAALCLTDRICYDRSSGWRNLKKLIMYSAKLVVNSPLLLFFFFGGGGRIRSVRYTQSRSTDSSRNVSLNILTYFLAKINGEERIFHSKKRQADFTTCFRKAEIAQFLQTKLSSTK